jgi:Flp pilus assembly pilin Flp
MEKKMLKQFFADESGMEMVEWAIVGVLFAVVAAAGWTTLADQVTGALENIGSELE